MQKKILITGGAGFIGSHLADELIRHDYQVRILDNLLEQVHGPESRWPDYLNRDTERLKGDIRNPSDVRDAVKGVDAVFHFSSRVGVGQSMYEIGDYLHVNDLGAAVLLEALLDHPVERLITASSMSIYGEGLYRTVDGEISDSVRRRMEDLRNAHWEPMDREGRPLLPLPVPETKPPSLASVYALSKFDQEQLSLIFGRAYHQPVTALRFFNVYSSRQALSNPYTGVLAIFSSRYMNGNPPLIYEDGLQQRDFVQCSTTGIKKNQESKRECHQKKAIPLRMRGRIEMRETGPAVRQTVRPVRQSESSSGSISTTVNM